MIKTARGLSLAGALLIFPFAGTLRSQTLAVGGELVDPAGASVAEAEVRLAAENGTELKTTRTDVRGFFRFEGLTVGSYRLLVDREGFRTAQVRVRLPSRGAAPVKITLALAVHREELTVSGEADRVNSRTSDNLDIVRLDRATLDNLPALGQDFVGTLSRFVDAASVGTTGAAIVVDGMPTSERGVSASAILEVRINQNPYSAEFSRQGRSRIEIITSPGASSYHGAFNFLFRDHHLDARNAFAPTKPVEQRRVYEGSLTGPIGNRERNSFLLSANYEQDNAAAVVFARTPQGDVRENFSTPARNLFVSARFNRQISANNQLSLRYEFADQKDEGVGAGGFVLPEAAADASDRQNHVYVQTRSVISPRVLNEFQIRMGRHWNPTNSRLQDVTRDVVLDAFTGGSAQADRLSTENHFQFHNLLSWTAGRHLVKTGVTSPDLSRRGLSDRTNFIGTWTFSSLEEHRLGRPISFVQQQGNGYMVIWEKILGVFLNDDWRLHRDVSISVGVRWDWQNFLPDRANFAPRFALAWAPGGNRRTVVRAGAGFFYDRTGSRSMLDSIRYDGSHLREVLVEAPGSYPLPPAGAGLRPRNLVRFEPGTRLPYAVQYSVTVERQIDRQTSLSAAYIGTRGISLFRSRDVNAPFPPFLARPDRSIGVLRQFESNAHQKGNALEVTFRGRASKYFNATAQYVLSGTRNNSGGIYSLPAYNYDLSPEWGRADFDERHRVNLAGTLSVNSWVNLGVLFSAGTGRPYNITTGFDTNSDGVANDRPPGSTRNTGRGPDAAALDARWSRDWMMSAKRKDKGPVATFALEGFNLLNRVNYVTFAGTLSSPFFGQPVSARSARRMQVSFRFRF